jgi:ribosomal protein L11 methyltransferase
VASELDEDRDEWQVEVYTEGRPTKKLIETMMSLLGRKNRKPPRPSLLPAADWVTLSQAGLEPVRSGRFHVHTGNDAPDRSPGIVNFRIDAGQAFGTGHHDTTAGCLLALDRLKQQGRRYMTVADIGTGTGLLAFAALHLWPRAFAVASDIDPVSVKVSAENAVLNAVPLGFGPGKLVLVTADGTRHPLITEAGPYDLVCANILAGPLIALAPSLAEITAEGGQLLLAGLLEGQSDAVIAAYRRVGFRVDQRSPGAQWPVLVLTMRRRPGWRRPIRSNGSAGQPPGDFGSW